MTVTTAAPTTTGKPARGRVKCVVWDLDETLWTGTLLEDASVAPRAEVVETIRALDTVGVLHSIASRNDHDLAMARLAELGLDHLFLHPQISWNPKSQAVARVAAALNIGLDAIAFVDDQEFERAEVAHAHGQVLCVDAREAAELPGREEFRPRFVTNESRLRREMYRSDAQRAEVEDDFAGTNEEFLATLGMELTIAQAQEEDLQRAEELTIRTNQLNSTGVTYSYEELDALRSSPDHTLLVASLVDRYGSYGKIGLALVEHGDDVWYLRMLLMSCRVMARGVGTVLLNHVVRSAHEAGAALRADFVETGRNRMMFITYAFGGFREVEREGERVVLQADPSVLQDPPEYLTVHTS